MELKYLKTFATLAETLSFSKTAELLYLSNSTVTKHINALERELGAELLIRNTRSVALTPQGRSYLSRITPALQMLSEADQNLAAAEEEPPSRRLLLIGCDFRMEMVTNQAAMLVAAASMLEDNEPSLRVQVLSGPRNEIEAALAGGRLDFAVIPADSERTELDARFQAAELFSDTQVLIMKERPGLTYTQENIPALLNAYGSVYLANHEKVYPEAIALFTRLGIAPRIELCDSFITILYNVMCRSGVTMFPRRVYEHMALPGAVCVELPEKTSVHALWRRGETNPFIGDYIACCRRCLEMQSQ